MTIFTNKRGGERQPNNG